MALRSYTIWQSLYVNFLANTPKEQDELAGARSNADSDEAPTPLKASTPPLVPPSTKDLFTKFMKVFIETTQVQALTELQERLLKARTLEIYWGKFHIKC